MKPRFTLNPRDMDALVAQLDPRLELAYRLAIRGLCDGCRGDRRVQRAHRRADGEISG
jgi:hypothetical protein